MCATDLHPDPDPDITEDKPVPGEITGQHPGVAWGRADRRDRDPAGGGTGTR